MKGNALSLCMIVRDEAAFLGDCLRSVADVVDEVVIVDTGSTDGTQDIARQWAHRFFEQPWDDDFAAARNASVGAATGDWILVLDADERLRAGGGAALRGALEVPDVLAYRMRVCNQIGGGKTADVYIQRLFRNRSELRYEGRIHEQISGAVARVAAAGRLRVPILEGVTVDHLGYDPAAKSQSAKSERNIRLLRAAVVARPDDPYVCYKLSQELCDQQESDELLFRAAQLALTLPPESRSALATAAELLTVASLRASQLGRAELAMESARAALIQGSGHPATLTALGLAFLAAGRREEALSELERALYAKAPAHSFYFDELGCELAARAALARIHRELGDHDRAMGVLRDGVSRHPGEEVFAAELIEALLAARRPKDALRAGLELLRSRPTSKRIFLLCAKAAEMNGDNELARNWRKLARE